MKLLRLAAIAAAGLCVSACIHHQEMPADVAQNPNMQISDAAANQIAEAAASVSHSLTNLEAVEKANMAPHAAKIYPSVAVVTIPGVSSVDWNGPIAPLLKQIADATGYHLKVYGTAPVVPIIVTLHATQEPNADIVRSAALQAGNRATVTTLADSKVLELRYQQQ